jgi:polysaccharide export outer membrane protein
VPAAVESGGIQVEGKKGEVSGQPVLGSASTKGDGALEKQPSEKPAANAPLVEVPKSRTSAGEETLTVQAAVPSDPGQLASDPAAMSGTSKPAALDPSPRTAVYAGGDHGASASARSDETLDYDGITSEPLANRPQQFDLISSLISAEPLPPLSSAPSNNAVAGLTLNLAKMTSVDTPQPFRVVPGTNQPRTREYVIGEQDVLTITVWKERELSETVTVRPDGKITIPLLNEIKVAGLTPTELRTLLTEKFKPFVVAPEVTVAVREIHSRHVYLVGEVGRTGAFSLNNATTTVLQLIAEAGGLKDFAKRKRIYIVRHQGGKEGRFAFNYDEVIKGRNAQQNIILKPGDMVVVP